MSGIVFFGTNKLDELRAFYEVNIGCQIWLEQADCIVFKHDNFLFGFCKRQEAETNGILCFFYSEQKTVDDFYDKFNNIALAQPILNEKYEIYHFFVTDPEGRKVEFQHFIKEKQV